MQTCSEGPRAGQQAPSQTAKMCSRVCFAPPMCCLLISTQAPLPPPPAGRVAAFIHETVQGVGGAVALADGYLPEVYKVGGRVLEHGAPRVAGGLLAC